MLATQSSLRRLRRCCPGIRARIAQKANGTGTRAWPSSALLHCQPMKRRNG